MLTISTMPIRTRTPSTRETSNLVRHILRLRALGRHLEVRCIGDSADVLASAMTASWSRCLSDGGGACGPSDALHLDAHLDDPGRLAHQLMRTTQEITRTLIAGQAGRLLMLHAGAVSHPETGASLVYVAPGGTGKTTLSRLLGQRFGYLTDETVGIADDGAIHPYPKPLSVRRPDAPHLKDELSPDGLGLLPAPIAPQVARIIVLDRDPELGTSVETEELSVMDALFAVVEQTSSLSWLDRPLHRLADLLEASGPVLRVRYAEASEIEDYLSALLAGRS